MVRVLNLINKNLVKTTILRVTPTGLSNRQYAEIKIKTSANNKFIELDRLTNSLGNSKRKWVRSINKNIKNDRDLGLALLFSKKAPEIKTILNTRKLILENDNCPKYEKKNFIFFSKFGITFFYPEQYLSVPQGSKHLQIIYHENSSFISSHFSPSINRWTRSKSFLLQPL